MEMTLEIDTADGFQTLTECPCARCKSRNVQVFREPCRSCSGAKGWTNFSEARKKEKLKAKFKLEDFDM